MIKLDDTVNVLSGFAFKSKFFNTDSKGLPLIRIRDVSSNSISTYYEGEYNDDYIIENGDLLVGMDGQFNLVEWTAGKALLNQRVCKISPTYNRIDKGFVKHLLPKSLKEIEDKTSFVTVKHLSVKKIKEIRLPEYSLPEQQRIAQILDNAAALRDKTKQLLAEYDTLAQSIFLDMFDLDIKTNEIELGSVIKLLGGGTPSKEIEEYWSGNVPWASVKDLKTDTLNSTIDSITELGVQKSATRIVPKGSLIICTRMAVGKSVITRIDTAINQDLKMVVIKEGIIVDFLHYLFKSKLDYFNRVSSGATVKGIKLEHITKMKINLPPIQLQNQFSKKIENIEQQKELAKQELQEAENLFNTLLQKAFKGEL